VNLTVEARGAPRAPGAPSLPASDLPAERRTPA
jgi:hypothetical protein